MFRKLQTNVVTIVVTVTIVVVDQRTILFFGLVLWTCRWGLGWGLQVEGDDLICFLCLVLWICFLAFIYIRPHKLGDIYCPLFSWMKFPMTIYNIESSELNSLEEKWNLRDVLLQFVEVLCHVESIMSPNSMRLNKIAKISIDSIVNLWSILCHKQFGFICVTKCYSMHKHDP